MDYRGPPRACVSLTITGYIERIAKMIEIEIVNWRSYVARGDIKTISWFKLSTDISKDKKLFGLTPAQKWAFVVILCEACKENDGGRVSFTEEYLLNFCTLNKKDLAHALQHFKSVGLIDIPQDFSSPTDQECKTFGSSDDVYSSKTRQDQTRLDESRLDHTRAKSGSSGRKRQPKESDHLYDLTDSELDLGRKWLEMAVSEMPHKATDPKWHAAKFGEDLKAVAKTIGYTHEQMAEVFHFVSSSEFWRPNACSPKQLLKTNDAGMRKIDTIISRMKSPGERKREIGKELISDPNRPTKSGISLNRIRELQGLPPLDEV